MSKYPGATWTSSHIYGQGLKNIGRKLFYVQVPKCASMWVREYFSNLDDSNHNPWLEGNFVNDDLKDYKYIVILRDPVQRWISTCPAKETIVKISKNINSINSIFDNLLDWMLDEHSAPQFDFINGLDFSKIVFFYSDQYLSSNIRHFVENNGFKNTNTPLPINQQSQDTITLEAVAAWKILLNDPVNFTKFKQSFINDYRLINSVNFYRSGEIKK
jgi:hypothetical protein